MSKMTPQERKLRASIAGHTSWANTDDRVQRLAPARQAFADSFLDKVDPDHKLDPAERAKRAENARRAHYQRLSLKSAQVRRRRQELESDEAELAHEMNTANQADRTDLGTAS